MKNLDVRMVSIALLAGTLFSLVAHSQSPPPALPEGNTGIAASYPNDSGIAANANVVFADGFDSYTSLSQMAGNYNGYFQQSNFALDTSTFFGGSKALRIRMPQSGSEINNALIKSISPTRDKLFVRVYLSICAQLLRTSGFSQRNSYNGQLFRARQETDRQGFLPRQY